MLIGGLDSGKTTLGRAMARAACEAGKVAAFVAGDVYALPVHPAAVPTSVEQRAANREIAMERYFSKPLQRWRVKPTVFLPTLPALFDVRELDRLLVGLSDGQGTYLGIGYLEHSAE